MLDEAGDILDQLRPDKAWTKGGLDKAGRGTKTSAPISVLRNACWAMSNCVRGKVSGNGQSDTSLLHSSFHTTRLSQTDVVSQPSVAIDNTIRRMLAGLPQLLSTLDDEECLIDLYWAVSYLTDCGQTDNHRSEPSAILFATATVAAASWSSSAVVFATATVAAASWSSSAVVFATATIAAASW